MNQTQNPPRARWWANSRRDKRLNRDAYVVLPNSTPIFVKDKFVGRVYGDVFVKWVVRRKHLFRKLQGYCFDVSTLEEAKQHGAQWVELREEDTRQTYRVAIAHILRLGTQVNEGYGKQIGLPLKYFSRGEEPVGEQMDLWAADPTTERDIIGGTHDLH